MKHSAKLGVIAGEHDRRHCPVSVRLPWTVESQDAFALVDIKEKREVPCQVDLDGDSAVLHWIVDRLKAGRSRKYALTRSTDAKSRERRKFVALKHDAAESRVDVYLGKRLVTSYHFGSKWVRPFLHPVMGPGNVRVTRNWPITTPIRGEDDDHVHHKSIWVAYGDCGGMDNWSEEPGHGYQRHRRFECLSSGPVFARIVATNDWCDKDGLKRFEERRDIRVYAVTGPARLLDHGVTFRMGEERITFSDTKEGGLLSVRVAGTMEGQKGGRIENSYGGVGERETWGRPASWCDYSGEAEGEHVGIAVFDHESNPRYPTTWHVRNYGLMTANCFGQSYFRPQSGIRGDMTFGPGSATTWRYRVYIHRGDAAKGRVRDRFLDFVAPPEVEVAF